MTQVLKTYSIFLTKKANTCILKGLNVNTVVVEVHKNIEEIGPTVLHSTVEKIMAEISRKKNKKTA